MHSPSTMLTRILLAIFILLSFFSTAQVSVTATAGTTGPTNYTALKLAFDAINAGAHRDNITIIISANTTEPAPAVLNGRGIGAASYFKVLIKPAPGASPVVSGIFTSLPVIRLNGASNVSIDGSNNGTNSRDLTITNTGSRAMGINIASVGTTPIIDVSVLNTNVICALTTDSWTGIAVGGVGNSTPGYFKNIYLSNNVVKRAGYGISLIGVPVSQNGVSCRVEDNQMDATGTDAIRSVGVFTQGVTGMTIFSNKIGNFDGTSLETDAGVIVDNGSNNILVSYNEIHDIVYTGAQNQPAFGILLNTNTQNCAVVITENSITNIGANGNAVPAGIGMAGTSSGITLLGNKISKIWNTNPLAGAMGIMMTSSTNGTAADKIYNNFISDIAAPGNPSPAWNANAYGIAVLGPGPYEIDYNTVIMSPNNIRGTADHSAAMFINSYVGVSGIGSLRNNIFVNQQTSNGANSKPLALLNASAYAIYAFANIDHNDYYSASNLLASDGTTDATSLPLLQALLGGNGNSKNILPTFVSATDFHLANTGNAGIEDAGTPIIGIYTDFDKETRSALTPDIGADETTCTTPGISSPPGPQTVAPGDNASFSVTATGAGPLTYQWEVNDGSGFAPIINNTTYSNATTATLNITGAALSMKGYLYRCVVTGMCTTATTSTAALLTVRIVLTVLQEPADVEVCEHTSALLSVTVNNLPGITYQWQESSNGNSWQNINGANNSSYTAPGTITRTLRCQMTTPGTTLYTRTVQFTVHPTPAIQATVTGYTDCAGTSVQLNATGALTYLWSPWYDLNSPSTAHPIASPVDNTLYTVEGQDAFGCRTTAQVQVDIRQNNFLKMANAFSPNNDGYNDCFGIRSWGRLLKVDFSIFNRYGMLVFHTANAAECWNGKLKGNDQPTGTFVYFIVAVTECGVFKRRGTVTLVR